MCFYAIKMVMGSQLTWYLCGYDYVFAHNYTTFPWWWGCFISKSQAKAGRESCVFPCHAAMKPISINPIHNPWILLYGHLTMWGEEGVDLHECSSTSLLGKCWICSRGQEQPHKGLWGCTEAWKVWVCWKTWTRTKFGRCTKADSSLGRILVPRERQQTMINSTDPAVSFEKNKKRNIIHMVWPFWYCLFVEGILQKQMPEVMSTLILILLCWNESPCSTLSLTPPHLSTFWCLFTPQPNTKL